MLHEVGFPDSLTEAALQLVLGEKGSPHVISYLAENKSTLSLFGNPYGFMQQLESNISFKALIGSYLELDKDEHLYKCFK